MSNFSTDIYKIEGTELQRIIDEDGEYWYPIQNFFNKILLRRCNVTLLRDSEAYSKFMKVFKIVPLGSKNGFAFKTWCMNTEGMYIMLQKTYVKPDSPKKMQVRERRLNAARIFFNVKIKNPGMFLTYRPDISNYDIWSIMCINNDVDLSNDDVWKRCELCGYYYPCTHKYFKEFRNNIYSENCLECEGINFKCDNKRIQWIYDHGGLNLLYNIFNEDKDLTYEELLKFIGKGGI